MTIKRVFKKIDAINLKVGFTRTGRVILLAADELKSKIQNRSSHTEYAQQWKDIIIDDSENQEELQEFLKQLLLSNIHARTKQEIGKILLELENSAV